MELELFFLKMKKPRRGEVLFVYDHMKDSYGRGKRALSWRFLLLQLLNLIIFFLLVRSSQNDRMSN